MTISTDYFPPEFIQEVLLRLPTKSIIRFRSVNKSWNSLISSKAFLNAHLIQNQTSDSNSHLLLRISDELSSKDDFLFYPYNRPNELFTNSSLPIIPQLNTRSTSPRIVGICNGLICFIDDFDSDDAGILLWNPSIRKSVRLPNPGIKLEFPEYFAMGFGVDSLNSDYKVVKIVYHVKGENYVGVEVFSLSRKVWRKLKGVRLDCFLPPPTGIHACVNDCVHWIGWRKEGRSRSLIMSFDVREEVFKEIMLPGDLGQKLSFDSVVSVARGCLCVIHYGLDKQCYLSLWMMKEYGVEESWTVMFSLDYRFLIRSVDASRFSRSDNLLIRKSSSVWARYDPENELMMPLDLFGLGSSIQADEYEESLVLLKHEGLQGSSDRKRIRRSRPWLP